MLFRAQLVNSAGVAYPSAQQYLSRGYFLGDSRGNLVKVLRGGDPEPSGTIPGATLQTDFRRSRVDRDPPNLLERTHHVRSDDLG